MTSAGPQAYMGSVRVVAVHGVGSAVGNILGRTLGDKLTGEAVGSADGGALVGAGVVDDLDGGDVGEVVIAKCVCFAQS